MIELILALIVLFVTGISFNSSRESVSAQKKCATVRDGYFTVNESAEKWIL